MCTDCGGTFSHVGELWRHRKRPGLSRPFKCSLRDKAFKFSSECKRHIQTHGGVQNYTCEICEEQFNSNSAYKNTHRGSST